MIYAISILFWLAILHFIYEGIILPSIRLNLRYKLFVLRDELRSLRHEVAIVVGFFQKIFSLVKDIVSLSENDLHKLMPAHSAT